MRRVDLLLPALTASPSSGATGAAQAASPRAPKTTRAKETRADRTPSLLVIMKSSWTRRVKALPGNAERLSNHRAAGVEPCAKGLSPSAIMLARCLSLPDSGRVAVVADRGAISPSTGRGTRFSRGILARGPGRSLPSGKGCRAKIAWVDAVAESFFAMRKECRSVAPARRRQKSVIATLRPSLEPGEQDALRRSAELLEQAATQLG